MTKEKVRTFVQRQPFTPFTIHLADGRAFKVHHRDYLIIPPEKGMTLIAYQPGGREFDFVYIKLITSISSEGEPPRVASKTDQADEG